MITNRFWLVFAGALVTAVSAAHADPYQPYASPYANLVPVDPNAEPAFELGLRYWGSSGKLKFDLNSSKVSPGLGNPTSTLNYDGTEGNTGELFFRGRGISGNFAKGFIGGGGLNGGNLADEDFSAGQVKFSDTSSTIKGNGLGYGTIDLGHAFNFGRFTASPLLGFNYWEESISAYGARCEPDDVGGSVCGPAGSIEVPFSQHVINDKATWASLRIGGELQVTLFNRLTLIGDAAYLPVAYLWNYDSHVLRPDLGPTPNVEDKGLGWGYQLEGGAKFAITQRWSIGGGVRYWYAQTSGDSDFLHIHVNSQLNDFSSERFGGYADMSYKFF